MIEKIYELSKAFCQNESDAEKLSEYLSRETVYFVVIETDKKTYKGITSAQPSKYGKKLLFVSQSGNFTTSLSPTLNLQGEKNDREKDEKKVRELVSKFINFFNHKATEDTFKILKENEEKIFQEIFSKAPADREKAAISILFVRNGEELPPAEDNNIVDVFLYRQLNHEDEKKYGKCFLCGKNKDSYPQLNRVFKFATFDKPGFTPAISKESTGIISVCDDCRKDLKAARTFIENKLQYNFYTGDKLWIIPSAQDRRYLGKIIDSLKDLYAKSSLVKLSKIEKSLERKLSEVESVSYDFIILSISNNEEKILMHASEVSPSRLAKIVDESDAIKSEFGDRYNITKKSFLDFFKAPKSKKTGKKNYYELLKAIYEGSNYSKDVFLSYLMRWIRSAVSYSDARNLIKNITFSGKNAFAHYLYLIKLGVLKGGKKVEGERFFERYSEFFDHPWKKAVFLTGVLAGYVIGYQNREKDHTAFVKKLKGLKMRKEDVEGLLPEIKAKVFQYKILSKDVEREFQRASEFYMEAGDWNASVDEINFVFTVGMSMSSKFIREDEQDEKE